MVVNGIAKILIGFKKKLRGTVFVADPILQIEMFLPELSETLHIKLFRSVG